ncbi:MAG: recombination protein RecR, partial [Oscillospiraceae bacterium]|nr:recombination protein RecR [Oscillospiraceae bacterium]
MGAYPAALERLTEQFARLPGIGGKTAQRLAFYILNLPPEEARAFADTIVEARTTMHSCPVCQNLTDQALCAICDDDRRDHGTICVV